MLVVCAGLMVTGCNSSSSSSSTQARDGADVQLVLEPEDNQITASWNAEDFSGVTFNLCLAQESLEAGFDNCTSYQGAQYLTDVSSPLTVSDLDFGSTYWFQVEAVSSSAGSQLSPVMSVTLVADAVTGQILRQGPYAAMGPYKEGSEVRFFALDDSTGQRLGSALATATVDEAGVFEVPALAVRWVEAEVSGEYLDLYTADGYVDDPEIVLSAFLDLQDARQGRNIQVLTHWLKARALHYLHTSQSGSLVDAYSKAEADVMADFGLSVLPSQLHLFYGPDLPEGHRDAVSTLIMLSTALAQRIEKTEQLESITAAYAKDRFESEDEELALIKTRLGDNSAFYLSRGLSRLGSNFPRDDQPDYWVNLARWLTGCRSAQAFTSRTILCLGEELAQQEIQFKVANPGGSTGAPGSDNVWDVYLYPEAAGMWALEVSMDEACSVRWTSYPTETVSGTEMGGVQFTSRTNHRLLGTQRMIPRLYLLRFRKLSDECDATQATLNFRRVSTGTDNVNSRGVYFLSPNQMQPGVSGGYQHTTANQERSTYRSYFFFNNTGPSGKYQFEVDFGLSSQDMDIVVEELGQFGYAPVSGAVTKVKTTSRTVKEYDLVNSRLYRVQVRNLFGRTSNLGSFQSYQRHPFELTVSRD
ncbi:MAG: hypothetical protein LAT62_00705 [Natronospirillum sp.]|uniref:hypothetical protein n=1 Tax=Natronospirillum sp. TaxID=2812955 RepID=UPI0025D37769|nr:hypothetical protein [Natronospirillum sp.]MCH8550422.1 hypothetical protein [Natronospirillum sp.]